MSPYVFLRPSTCSIVSTGLFPKKGTSKGPGIEKRVKMLKNLKRIKSKQYIYNSKRHDKKSSKYQ